MSKICILALAIVLLPVLAFAQPRLSFEAESHDFGQVKAGEPVSFEFKFSNTGTEELVIEKIVPS